MSSMACRASSSAKFASMMSGVASPAAQMCGALVRVPSSVTPPPAPSVTPACSKRPSPSVDGPRPVATSTRS